MPQIRAADIRVNQPLDGRAPDNKLTLDVDPARPLRPGTYTFRLVVTDDSGNLSAPVDFRISVVDEGKPIAVITGPSRVPTGQGFTLSGESSSDVGGGKLSKFTWTMIQAP